MNSIIKKLGLESKEELIVLLNIAMNKGYGYELVRDGYELTYIDGNTSRLATEEEIVNLHRDSLIKEYRDIKPASFFYIEDETQPYYASLTNDEYKDIKDLIKIVRAIRDIEVDEYRVIELLK